MNCNLETALARVRDAINGIDRNRLSAAISSFHAFINAIRDECLLAEREMQEAVVSIEEAMEASIAYIKEEYARFYDAFKTDDDSPEQVDLERERHFWNDASILEHEQIAAMMKALSAEMAEENARQVMKRRKLLPAEGSFPDLRCCATCRHQTPIGAEIRPACCGCIVGGECTKWEEAGGDADET